MHTQFIILVNSLSLQKHSFFKENYRSFYSTFSEKPKTILIIGGYVLTMIDYFAHIIDYRFIEILHIQYCD